MTAFKELALQIAADQIKLATGVDFSGPERLPFLAYRMGNRSVNEMIAELKQQLAEELKYSGGAE